MIVFMRVDDRLVHGQCQTRIIPGNNINRVVAIDEPTATNPTLKKVFEMSTGVGIKCTVQTYDAAVNTIRKCIVNDKRTLIIARRPETFARLYKDVEGLPKVLNCANIPYEGKGFMIRRDTWIDETQQAALNEMDAMGVDVYFEQFPNDGESVVHWKDEKDKH